MSSNATSSVPSRTPHSEFIAGMWLSSVPSRTPHSEFIAQRSESEFFEWIFSPLDHRFKWPLVTTIQNLVEILDSDSECDSARDIEKCSLIEHYTRNTWIHHHHTAQERDPVFDQHAIKFLEHLWEEGYFAVGGTKFLKRFED